VVYFKIIFQMLLGLTEETHYESGLHVIRSSGLSEFSTSDWLCDKTVLIF